MRKGSQRNQRFWAEGSFKGSGSGNSGLGVPVAASGSGTLGSGFLQGLTWRVGGLSK